jgi:DNA polymerase III alpha subunit (gram-positive type)
MHIHHRVYNFTALACQLRNAELTAFCSQAIILPHLASFHLIMCQGALPAIGGCYYKKTVVDTLPLARSLPRATPYRAHHAPTLGLSVPRRPEVL